MASSLFGCHATIALRYTGAQCILGIFFSPSVCCLRERWAINTHCAFMVHSCVASLMQHGLYHTLPSCIDRVLTAHQSSCLVSHSTICIYRTCNRGFASMANKIHVQHKAYIVWILFSVEFFSCYDSDESGFGAMTSIRPLWWEFDFNRIFYWILDATANVRACCLGDHLGMSPAVPLSKSIYEKYKEDVVACLCRAGSCMLECVLWYTRTWQFAVSCTHTQWWWWWALISVTFIDVLTGLIWNPSPVRYVLSLAGPAGHIQWLLSDTVGQ